MSSSKTSEASENSSVSEPKLTQEKLHWILNKDDNQETIEFIGDYGKYLANAEEKSEFQGKGKINVTFTDGSYITMEGQWQTPKELGIPDIPIELIQQSQEKVKISENPPASYRNPGPNGWYERAIIVYTKNKYTERVEGIQNSLVAPEDMLKAPNGETLKKALLTTFVPWSRSYFIDNIPEETDLTLVVTLDAKNRKLNKIDEAYMCTNLLHPDWLDGSLKMKTSICDLCYNDLLPSFPGKYYICLDDSFNICSKCYAEGTNKHVKWCSLQEVISDKDAKSCNCKRKRKLKVVEPQLKSEDYSIMHIKLCVLQFESHIRIIISSFNIDELFGSKAGESMWIQDFKYTTMKTFQNRGMFFKDLNTVIKALGCEEWAHTLNYLKITDDQIDKFTRLIATIPQGVTVNAPYFATGSRAMLHQLKMLYLTDSHNAQNLSPLIIQVYSMGGAALKRKKKMLTAFGTTFALNSVCCVISDILNNFDGESSMRQLGTLYTAEMANNRCFWHSKAMFRFYKDSCEHCSRLHGWLYVGSHNFSTSSWENANWELGVLWCSPKPLNKGEECGELDMKSLTFPFPLSDIKQVPAEKRLKFHRFDDSGNSKTIIEAYGIITDDKKMKCDLVTKNGFIRSTDIVPIYLYGGRGTNNIPLKKYSVIEVTCTCSHSKNSPSYTINIVTIHRYFNPEISIEQTNQKGRHLMSGKIIDPSP